MKLKLVVQIILFSSVFACPAILFGGPPIVLDTCIYPMPVNESALLEWTFDLRSEATVTIYNSHGERIENISVALGEGHVLNLDTKQLLPGIYFVSLGNADFRYVTKLVKL